ncbi:MAG: PQQ-binding-like beta-propeller repeat protein [Candidatus Hydrogenedentes bacterium]|nr:PQQ-binding-like beta-propeller repeat protein [Candidatus Hydrogenedentota bacterium]
MFSRISTRSLSFALVFFIISIANADANWPQFRGPEARGVAEGANLPDTWSTTENIAWKTDIPGRGWSSPVVWGNRIFFTTVVSQGEVEAAKKGLYFGGNRDNAPDMVHMWKVYCLDLESGKVVWEKQVHEGKPVTPRHIKNSYASETPVVDAERIYAFFGNLGVWCFDHNGRELWKVPVEPKKTGNNWGTAASPALHDNALYICNDNEEQSYLVALDKKTGKEIWRVTRNEQTNWATPFVWVNEKRAEIVTPGSGQVRSYGLDGKELWSLTGMSSITIGTPYAAHGLLYISSGYVMDKRRPVYAIKPGASGDISLSDGQTANEFVAWSQPLAAPYNPSTLVYGDRLYVLYDRSQLSCYNAKDGTPIYDRQKLPGGGGFTTSPWAYNDKVFCLDEDGKTYVVKAGDTFEILRENKLAEDDMGMATPAIVGDKLILRTAARVYCVAKGAKLSSAN